MRFVFDEEKQQMMEVIGPVDRNDLVLNVQRANEDIEEYDRVFGLQTKPAEPDAPAEPANDPAAEADKTPADEPKADDPKAAEATPPAVPAPGTEAAAPADPAAKDEFGDEKPDDTKEFE